MPVVLQISGATPNGDNYLTWTPRPAILRQQPATAAAANVRLRNAANTVGQASFTHDPDTTPTDALVVAVPADGTPVTFSVAGKFGSRSVNDKDAAIEVVNESDGTVFLTKQLMVRIRKNADKLTLEERDRFLAALSLLNEIDP